MLDFLSEMNKGKARKKMSEAEKREKVAEGLRRKKECDRIALDVVTRDILLVMTNFLLASFHKSENLSNKDNSYR